MVSAGSTSPPVGIGTAPAALPRQRVVSALCSITLHVVGIGLSASVLVRQQVAPREIIRLTLLGDRGGGTKGAPVASAAPARAVAPPAVEVPAPVMKPVAAIKPRVAKRPARRVEAAMAKPAPAVAVPQPIDSGASTSAATVGNGGFGAGPGVNAGGAGSGRGTGDGSGSGGDGDRIQEYLATLRARIERSKRYPLLARRGGVEGRAAVAFEVTATGHVQHLRLAGTTHPLLGQAALNAVEGAAPFPQLPSDIVGPPLLVEIALRFALEEP